MALAPFATVKEFDTEVVLAPKAPGMNAAVFFNPRPGKSNLFIGMTDMKQSFYVRPNGASMDGIKKNPKFEINLQVDTSSPQGKAFVQAATLLDDYVLAQVFARKTELLPAKAAYIPSVDALKPLYVSGKFIKEGGTTSDGESKYAPTIKLKVVGEWHKYVTGVTTRTVTIRGQSRGIPDQCTWSARTEPVQAHETKFYLWKRTNDKGEDVYTDKIALPANFTAGTGAATATEYRMVGPQDAKPGCLITPVFGLNCVYFSDGFGVSAVARAIYIKPRLDGRGGEDGYGGAAGAAPAPAALLPGISLEADEDMMC